MKHGYGRSYIEASSAPERRLGNIHLKNVVNASSPSFLRLFLSPDGRAGGAG